MPEFSLEDIKLSSPPQFTPEDMSGLQMERIANALERIASSLEVIRDVGELLLPFIQEEIEKERQKEE
jgi:hypothetical protein